MAFRGQHEHSLDSKDRVTIPARFRAALADGVVLSQGLDPCVEVFPADAYADFEQRFLSGLNPFSREGRRMQRRFSARSVEETLDSAGRIRLPKKLIEHAGLQGTCVVTGMGNRLEIWNPEHWDEENSVIDEEAERIAEGLAGAGAGSPKGE